MLSYSNFHSKTYKLSYITDNSIEVADISVFRFTLIWPMTKYALKYFLHNCQYFGQTNKKVKFIISFFILHD